MIVEQTALENEGTWSAFIAGHTVRCEAVELNHQGRVTMANACETFRMFGIRAVFYTAPSSTKNAQYWRAVLPLSCPNAPITRYGLNRLLGGILDPASFTFIQAVFYGKIEGSEHECLISEGVCIDETRVLEAGSMSNSDEESAITEIVDGGGVGLSESVLCSSYLSRALRTRDMGIDLKTSALTRALERAGYTKIAKRQRWNGKPHFIWVKGRFPVWNNELKNLLDASISRSEPDFFDYEH
jgi:hypothetical protein